MKSKILLKLLFLCALISVIDVSAVVHAEENRQTISITGIDEKTVTIDTTNITDEKTSYYTVLDSRTLEEIDSSITEDKNIIKVDLEGVSSFFLVSLDENKNEITSSDIITVYTEPASLDSIILSNDIYMTELTATSGDIDLNSFSLNVLGDAIISSDVFINAGTFNIEGKLLQPSGCLTIGKGELNVKGDYRIVNAQDGPSSGRLIMTKSEDRVNVDGDFKTDSIYSHSEFLTDGVFRLEGSFYQEGADNDSFAARSNFDTNDNFKIVFCGDDTQVVYFFDPKRSQLNIWEVENESEKPMEIPNGFGIRTLKQDSVIPCDVEFWSHLYDGTTASSIDLNGYTLLIKGTVVNNRVNLRIGRGTLIIEGDYKLQIPQDIGEEQPLLRWTYGTLRMLYEEDYMLVMGDFLQDSYYSHTKSLVAGTLEVKGDFRQITTNYKHDTYFNFDANGTHKVILSGEGLQIVDFEDPETNQFNILEIPETDKPGHIILFTSVWRANELIVNSDTTVLLNWYEKESEEE